MANSRKNTALRDLSITVLYRLSGNSQSFLEKIPNAGISERPPRAADRDFRSSREHSRPHSRQVRENGNSSRGFWSFAGLRLNRDTLELSIILTLASNRKVTMRFPEEKRHSSPGLKQ